MIKRLLAFLAVIWLIIAILAPSFLAPQIDAQLHAFFDSAEAHRLRANGIDLQLDNYQRGYFSSQADIHVNIRPYDGQPTWYRTTLHARINHAPLFNSGINLISATLGKTAGKDAAQGKNTYPALLGLDESRTIFAEHSARAQAATTRLPHGAPHLCALLARIIHRSH